jgi:hypothetical protein
MRPPVSSPKRCQAADCDRLAHGLGLCKRHYDAQRWESGAARRPRTTSTKGKRMPRKPTKRCTVDGGCSVKVFARGLCRKHYDAARKDKRHQAAADKRAQAARLAPRELPWLDLLLKVLADTPKLDGDCKDMDARMFDGETESDTRQALAVCEACPVRQSCAA